MFCALLNSRYQVSVYRTNGPLVILSNAALTPEGMSLQMRRMIEI